MRISPPQPNTEDEIDNSIESNGSCRQVFSSSVAVAAAIVVEASHHLHMTRGVMDAVESPLVSSFQSLSSPHSLAASAVSSPITTLIREPPRYLLSTFLLCVERVCPLGD